MSFHQLFGSLCDRNHQTGGPPAQKMESLNLEIGSIKKDRGAMQQKSLQVCSIEISVNFQNFSCYVKIVSQAPDALGPHRA